MGLRGPKPKPTALQLAKGDPGKRAKRKAQTEFIPVGGSVPKPPDCLDEEGKKEWRRILEAFGETPVVTQLDRGALTALCSAWSVFVNCEQQLRDPEDWVITLVRANGSEARVQNPLFKIRDKARADYMRFSAVFGLTPADRQRIQIERQAAAKNEDLLAQIIELQTSEIHREELR
jgi:P27 family predicted phage terminase small subunit